MSSNHTPLVVISLNSALKKDGNYYPQMFLKECKCIQKNAIRYINDNLSDFSSSDKSDDSDKEWVKDMRLIFLRKQFWKCIFWGRNVFFFFFLKYIFWGSNFENALLRDQFWKCIFEGAISKMYFLRKHFWKWIFRGSNFEEELFENILINTYVTCWLRWVILFNASNW